MMAMMTHTDDTAIDDDKQHTHIKDTDTVRIFDVPVEQLPDDLYIPPQAFAIWLEQFAGPLDFLLYLVKKNNFDLTETAILPITEQYLSYIKDLDEEYFELAGDYLLMASTLIAIKSELLLPVHGDMDDEVSPKARLIRRLEEYAQIKHAAQRLDGLIRLERDVFLAFTSLPSQQAMQAQLPSYSPNLLINSLINMRLKPVNQTHTVNIDPVPLPQRIASITHILSQKGQSTFAELLDKQQGKLGVVVSFVAVLELIKRGLIGFAQFASTDDGDTDDLDEGLFANQHGNDSHHNTHNLNEQILYWLH